MRAPIHSIKHYVQNASTAIASGGIAAFPLVTALAKGATRDSTDDVEEGAVIKACYVEYWVKADNPNFTVNAALLKLPVGVSTPSFAEMQNISAYKNKNNILEFHQGLAPSGDQVMSMFRGWYKIPKGKQRFALGDVLQVEFSLTGSAGDVCGFSTYKEYE